MNPVRVKRPAFNSLNLGFPSATEVLKLTVSPRQIYFQFPQSGISFCDLWTEGFIYVEEMKIFQFPQSGISFCDQNKGQG